jgi:hypothetical protein
VTARWFFSHSQQGVATGITAGSAVPSSVTFVREVDGGTFEEKAPGPHLKLVGPRDVVGIDPHLIFREEPPPGTADAADNFLAAVEFAHADLPWLLSTETVVPIPGAPAQPQPWLVLIVLSTDEASPPRPADPMPLLTAPVGALPPLGERWAWAHVEARLDDGVRADATVAAAQAAGGVRRRSGAVVARLLCPRQLLPDTEWIAAVVPVPETGRWGSGPTVDLPVHHWWTFHTGHQGDFEYLATRLRALTATDLKLGSRRIDGSRPWPPDGGDAAPIGDRVIIAMDGALRPPGPPDTETWSDSAQQEMFRQRMTDELNAPAARHEPGAAEPDRDTLAVGPPLYGSHHSGQQTVGATGDGWQDTLNLEVRRRVAAALGARYVQVEQEFLMARAWEQVGAIREANRRLATAELAALAATSTQAKNIVPQPPDMLVTTLAPIIDRVQLPGGFRAAANPSLVADNRGHATLAEVLSAAKVPDGMVGTAFTRVARPGGALSRRIARTSAAAEQTSMLAAKLPTTAATHLGFAADNTTMAERLCAAIAPLPLQWRRLVTEIGGAELTRRSLDDDRPLQPIMDHPHFDVPIAQEILSKWPEWALPGITALPDDSVVVMETNPGFVAALLVGLNQEFNRELLWREFPTDQRGTSFARFWPTAGNDVDEIARWPLGSTLGSQIASGVQGSIALLIRGALLRRFPGLPLLAVPGEPDGTLPKTFTGVPATQVPLDESTTLYLFSGISEESALAGDYFFVLREPMTGTRFGFDLPGTNQGHSMTSWARLEWEMVNLDGGRFIKVSAPPTTQPPGGGDLAVWGNGSADMARIAFQQPFQLAVPASKWLRP